MQREQDKQRQRNVKIHDSHEGQQMILCHWSRRYIGGGLGDEEQGPWVLRKSTHLAFLRFWGVWDGEASLTAPSGLSLRCGPSFPPSPFIPSEVSAHTSFNLCI